MFNCVVMVMELGSTITITTQLVKTMFYIHLYYATLYDLIKLNMSGMVCCQAKKQAKMRP